MSVLPLFSAATPPPGGSGRGTVEPPSAQNGAAAEASPKHWIVPCPRCGRMFGTETVLTHMLRPGPGCGEPPILTELRRRGLL